VDIELIVRHVALCSNNLGAYMSYHEERSIAAKAKAVVDTLTPATKRTDANVHAVLLAAGTARDAVKNFSSEATA
jgi:hypothetical protein